MRKMNRCIASPSLCTSNELENASHRGLLLEGNIHFCLRGFLPREPEFRWMLVSPPAGKGGRFRLKLLIHLQFSLG